MEGQAEIMGMGGEPLSDGHVVREGRGGTDAIASMLNSAVEEGLTGHLCAGKSSKAVRVALVKGVPVAIQAPKQTKIVEAVSSLTESRRVLHYTDCQQEQFWARNQETFQISISKNSVKN